MKKLGLLMITVWGFSVQGQSFDVYLDNAKTAYADKDYELAKLELQDALKVINEQASGVLMTTFPSVPVDWEASEVKKESNPMVGTKLTKLYKKEKSHITAMLTHNSPLIANYAAVFNNPMLMQGEKIRLGRDHAMLQMNDDGQSGELTYLIKGKYLIQIEGNNLSDKQIMIDLIKNWDIKTIKSLVAD